VEILLKMATIASQQIDDSGLQLSGLKVMTGYREGVSMQT
jgi:hypothetical protein